MDTSEASSLRSLLAKQPAAALATLHGDMPAVSMVPFALLPDGGFVIHVSRLASHTNDMLAHPSVALLVMDEDSGTPLARPRVSIQGEARRCEPESPGYPQARAAYLARLPEAEEMFSFPDFSLFVITATSARYVAGFGRALSITAEGLKALWGDRTEGAD